MARRSSPKRSPSRSSARPRSSALTRRTGQSYVQHPRTGQLYGPYETGSKAHQQALAQAAIVKHTTPPTPPPPSGMTSGEKVVLIGVGAAVVLGIFLLTRQASAAQGAPGATGATGAAGQTTRAAAASAMAQKLAANGYCQADSGTYTTYQQAAGLPKQDGYPGTDTMTALAGDLGVAATAIPGPGGTALALYPWKGPGEAGAVGGGGWVSGNVPAAFVNGSPGQWNPTNSSGCGT